MARLGTPLAQDLGLGGQVGRVSWIGRRGGLVHLGLAPAHQGLLAGLGIGLQFGEHGGFEGERLGAAQLALGQVGVDLAVDLTGQCLGSGPWSWRCSASWKRCPRRWKPSQRAMR
jgi:hypothetical protein